MSTNRRARSWPLKTQFTPEVLALFQECEADPEKGRAFTDTSRELARRLGLVTEWWYGEVVSNRRPTPLHGEPYCAHYAFFKCHAVREELLSVCAERAREAAEPPTAA